eukprot:1959832-Pyramimonas_sp.AAC.1
MAAAAMPTPGIEHEADDFSDCGAESGQTTETVRAVLAQAILINTTTDPNFFEYGRRGRRSTLDQNLLIKEGTGRFPGD